MRPLIPQPGCGRISVCTPKLSQTVQGFQGLPYTTEKRKEWLSLSVSANLFQQQQQQQHRPFCCPVYVHVSCCPPCGEAASAIFDVGKKVADPEVWAGSYRVLWRLFDMRGHVGTIIMHARDHRLAYIAAATGNDR